MILLLWTLLPTSTPFSKGLNSGQINALPAYAASMCIHIFFSLPAAERSIKWKSQFCQIRTGHNVLIKLVKYLYVCNWLTHTRAPARWSDRKHMMEWCQEWHRTETQTCIDEFCKSVCCLAVIPCLEGRRKKDKVSSNGPNIYPWGTPLMGDIQFISMLHFHCHNNKRLNSFIQEKEKSQFGLHCHSTNTRFLNIHYSITSANRWLRAAGPLQPPQYCSLIMICRCTRDSDYCP